MGVKKLYQTLENRDNPNEIESHGPYICRAATAWLGEGFYFWDTFVSNGHWWGTSKYDGNYFICRALCDFDSDNCFDLVGETDHMEDFASCIEVMRQQGRIDQNTTVAKVLSFMRAKIRTFTYEAVRAYGVNSISARNDEYEAFRFRLRFVTGNGQYLDYRPAIQLCLYRSTSLNLRDFKIIYPEEYTDGDVT